MKKKIIMDQNTHIEFSMQMQELIAQVKFEIKEIVDRSTNDQLLEYIQKSGTKVVRFKNAPFVLKILFEEEGLVTEKRGIKGFLFGKKPIFVLRTGEVNRTILIQQFYKWYSMNKGLPGFDYESQEAFKKSMRTRNIEHMKLRNLTGLSEAVARDREATDFAYEYAKKLEGEQKAFDKMNDGGASI
jgi:hypothetical protein